MPASWRRRPIDIEPGFVAQQLTAAIISLLPAINEVVAIHADGHCRHCTVASRRECPSLGLAADALGLAIRCRRLTRVERGPATPGPGPRRDLLTAVESKGLSDVEADALAEILEVLDLAVVQAEKAGLCLPILAGIGVAVVDSYRAAVAAHTPNLGNA